MSEDEVIKEIDVVLAPELRSGQGSSINGQLMPLVLQFPLRQKDRPYQTDSATPRIKYKYNVKRMHWDVPLDVDGPHYYDADFDERKQISHLTLKSSRVHQGVPGMCVGFLKENTLHLVPVHEVMQLRPSPNHLDKQVKEVTTPKDVGKSAHKDMVVTDAGKRSDLQPITVQIKKHETEQQTEARLRSYAFHAQQDEADMWYDLSYCGEQSSESVTIRAEIENSIAEEIQEEKFIPKSTYLEHLIGGTGSILSLHDPYAGGSLHGNGMGSNVGIERNMLDDSQDIGKPAKNIHKKQSKDTGMMTYSVNLSTDSFLSLKTTLDRLFEESAVLSLQKVRENLLKPHMNEQLQNFGRMGSDQEIHSCIMSFQKYIHLRNSYVRQLRGDSILDPLRSIVVDILQENEVIKRSDVMDKANELGVAVTDNMYSRVMKELCVSKGALWFMKSGD